MTYNMYVCIYVCMYVCIHIMYSVYKVDYRGAAAPKKSFIALTQPKQEEFIKITLRILPSV